MATWITDMTDIAQAGADVPEAARLRSEFRALRRHYECAH